MPPRILSAIIEFVYGDLSRNPQSLISSGMRSFPSLLSDVDAD
ncbi:hypothetical protein OOZ51_13140 [Arthrobacter sp. MI7-26]|nr:hypothetical protein [Arthrobacter sp. MI7-26]MCX2748749.1 hypothetical protein [Arthrobacter sp. MI7-26]